jgi:hypothetical protein
MVDVLQFDTSVAEVVAAFLRADDRFHVLGTFTSLTVKQFLGNTVGFIVRDVSRDSQGTNEAVIGFVKVLCELGFVSVVYHCSVFNCFLLYLNIILFFGIKKFLGNYFL